MAFYFAARGEGYELHEDGSRTPYTTPSKVFFSGLGADEQLGYLTLLHFPALLDLIKVDIHVTRQPGKDPTVPGPK